MRGDRSSGRRWGRPPWPRAGHRPPAPTGTQRDECGPASRIRRGGSGRARSPVGTRAARRRHDAGRDTPGREPGELPPCRGGQPGVPASQRRRPRQRATPPWSRGLHEAGTLRCRMRPPGRRRRRSSSRRNVLSTLQPHRRPEEISGARYLAGSRKEPGRGPIQVRRHPNRCSVRVSSKPSAKIGCRLVPLVQLAESVSSAPRASS